MAKDLSVSYWLVNRALTGSTPHVSLLTALVEAGVADARELLTGVRASLADFGVMGSVQPCPISPTLIAEHDLREVVSAEWPWLPVTTTTGLINAYVYTVQPTDGILRDPVAPGEGPSYLLIEQLDPDRWRVADAEGGWVVFKPVGMGRPLLGRLAADGRIRAAGEPEPRYRVGPDATLDHLVGKGRAKKPRVRYDAPVDGVTHVYRDAVAGRVLATLRWVRGFLVTEPVPAPRPGEPGGEGR